jgi:hypothetical protein
VWSERLRPADTVAGEDAALLCAEKPATAAIAVAALAATRVARSLDGLFFILVYLS